MTYTSLLVTDLGVVLYDLHALRIAPDAGPRRVAFERFARDASPGVYVVKGEGSAIHVAARGPSSLVDGLPVRFVVSPFAVLRSRFPKPAPPNVYASVRLEGCCTLLTDAAGEEIFESCVASVVGWDGARFVVPPPDRPRVASLAEDAIQQYLPCVARPIATHDSMPLLVVNAVKGTCAPAFEREAFPASARADIDALFERLTRRPA